MFSSVLPTCVVFSDVTLKCTKILYLTWAVTLAPGKVGNFGCTDYFLREETFQTLVLN